MGFRKLEHQAVSEEETFESGQQEWHSATLEPTSQPTILVIDDEPAVRRVLASILSLRYRVVTASRGVQIAEFLEQYHPDLIILDVLLPWLTGFDLCRLLKEKAESRNIPILLLTGCNDPEDRERGLSLGAAAYLTKPFYAQDLLREIDRLLKESPPRQSNASH